MALDATPLSLLCHPNSALAEVQEVRRWAREHLARGTELLIPEIADYEVRRELLRIGRATSVLRLDELQSVLTFLPLDTASLRLAAGMWATARRQGRPTADPKELDGDVILAAQAERAEAIIATANARHLSQFVEARHWRDIQ